jgi:hypothetical protein
MTLTPVCIMIFEPLLALSGTMIIALLKDQDSRSVDLLAVMAGMYIAVFKTKYVPRKKSERMVTAHACIHTYASTRWAD